MLVMGEYEKQLFLAAKARNKLAWKKPQKKIPIEMVKKVVAELPPVKIEDEIDEADALEKLQKDIEKIRAVMLGITKIKAIIGAVSLYYQIGVNEILSRRKTANLVKPRHVAMYLAKTLTTRSYPEIGRAMNGRDHTTVLHSVRKIEKKIKDDANLVEDVENLKRILAVG